MLMWRKGSESVEELEEGEKEEKQEEEDGSTGTTKLGHCCAVLCCVCVFLFISA